MRGTCSSTGTVNRHRPSPKMSGTLHGSSASSWGKARRGITPLVVSSRSIVARKRQRDIALPASTSVVGQVRNHRSRHPPCSFLLPARPSARLHGAILYDTDREQHNVPAVAPCMLLLPSQRV